MPRKNSPSKRKEIPQHHDPNAVDKALAVWEQASVRRAEYAIEAFNAQNERTREAISRIQAVLMANAGGLIRLRVPGRGLMAVQVEDEHIRNNALYIAVEMMKDLAYMDIKVADFEFPQAYCAKCGSDLFYKSETLEKSAQGRKAGRRG